MVCKVLLSNQYAEYALKRMPETVKKLITLPRLSFDRNEILTVTAVVGAHDLKNENEGSVHIGVKLPPLSKLKQRFGIE